MLPLTQELYDIAVPMIINGVSHPIEYAKVLIQVKYAQSINCLAGESSSEAYNFYL